MESEEETRRNLVEAQAELSRERQDLEQVRKNREQEEEDRIQALEKTARDLEEARNRIAGESTLTGAAMTARLEGHVRDLEEKHEILRHNLESSLDEKTVILFANDLIKRIDLIDVIIQRVNSPGVNGDMEQQLRMLRASFEDILEQHGIAQFKVAPGTEVNLDLRRRIAVVENVSGPARPRIVESYRPGFLYSTAGGREVILRKVEVKTSSE